MGLIKITFDGSSVSAEQDASLNHPIVGLIPAGVIKGLGGQCSASVSNNYITFQSGYVQIYGRRMFIEAGSQVYVALDSSMYGAIVITVTLSNNTAVLGKIESTSAISLTQENLLNGGNVYQFALCKYTKTTSSITLDSSYTPNLIVPSNQLADQAIANFQTKAEEMYGYSAIPTYNITSSGKYRYVTCNKNYVKYCLIGIKFLDSICYLPGPGLLQGSTFSSCYSILGTIYSLYAEWLTDGRLCLTLADSSHKVYFIYLFNHGGTK
jgi:hypothetical protein